MTGGGGGGILDGGGGHLERLHRANTHRTGRLVPPAQVTVSQRRSDAYPTPGSKYFFPEPLAQFGEFGFGEPSGNLLIKLRQF